MKRICKVIITAILAMNNPALSGEYHVNGKSLIGKDSIYMKGHYGVYMETSLTPRHQRGREL